MTSLEDQYIRLSTADSPKLASQAPNHFYHVFPDEESDDNDGQPQQPQQASWWHRFTGRHRVQTYESAYLTLIPLSDARLKPRRTRLIVTILLMLTLASVCAVFFLVERGVTVGSIEVETSRISFNTSEATYLILLRATLPIYNPNYLAVTVSGMVNVSFYDQQAGFTLIEPVRVAARAQPEVIQVEMDASRVPQKYLFTIYTLCFTFPEKLIFFLTGQLQANYLGKSHRLPNIDNYFIVSCGSGKQDDDDNSTEVATSTQSTRGSAHHPAALQHTSVNKSSVVI